MNMEEYVKYLLSKGDIEESTAKHTLKYLKSIPEKIKKKYNHPTSYLSLDESNRHLSFVYDKEDGNHNYTIVFRPSGSQLFTHEI